MKKILSLILALIMTASFAATAISAEILYEDDFEGDDFNWDFWDGIGKFVVENGKMSGWEDAKIGQSRYIWEDGKAGITTTSDWPCQREFTEWIDINVDEGGIGDQYSSGFWIQDGGDADRGWAADRTIYSVLYFAQDGEEGGPYEYAFVQLQSDSQMKDKRKEKPWGDHVYGRLYLPEYIQYDLKGNPVSGFNLEGDPVRIGVRFGKGNITAYANGKIVGSFDYETIGTLYTPLLVQNWNNYVEFDNYALGTYDHNVKKATRLDSYELYEGKVTVVDAAGNVVGTVDAAEDDELEITAPEVSGKTFAGWTAVAINGEVVTDFEKAELLYGIELGELTAEKFAITMPDCDVTLTASYEDGGSSSVIPGDANGDGKLNSRDVILVMKAALPGFGGTIVMEAADLNHDGKLNSRDVILVMKEMLK